MVVQTEVETESNEDRSGRIKNRPLQMNHISPRKRAMNHSHRILTFLLLIAILSPRMLLAHEGHSHAPSPQTKQRINRLNTETPKLQFVVQSRTTDTVRHHCMATAGPPASVVHRQQCMENSTTASTCEEPIVNEGTLLSWSDCLGGQRFTNL